MRLTFRRYGDGDWWFRIGRFTFGHDTVPGYVGLAEREGWTRVWWLGPFRATWDVR